ncbi:mucin-2-like [Acanthopagrus latus]|uniref:mucin-2-like n=1 Tax=Acanthopagrus latus TaxID=8177 RepID=UPI00187C6DC8|nr:mucin-2-like [Acanthopagrus latus]
MRLTALCICGTLLAFTSLSWTTVDSDEGDLLEYDGFGPCAATLRAEGPCRHGQDETTCPYLFSMPPLTVYLPKQLSELEKIVEDLQKLKDNVDELRRMCADCTVSQTERECGRQSEREHEKLNEKGTERRKDERNSPNERNPERLKEFRQECGTDRLKPGKSMKGDGDTDSRKRTTLEEKGRKRWETERESNKGVIKENEDEETRKAVAENDGKTQREGAKGKDELGQAKVPTAGGNERIVDIVREKVVERNNKERETDRNEEKGGRGISKGDQEDMLESGKERRITTNIKNKEKKEESDRHVWRDKTKEAERNTQTEEDGGSDGIKMSVDLGEHTNKEQEQNREERKKEMERGIKVDRNNEKPKQTESIGRAEKEKTIKEGAVEEEEEREIKTEVGKTVQSVQRDSDGELSSSKPIERTDFVSIRPTPHFTMTVAPRHDFKDSNEAETFTSSLPSPPASSSTSRLLTGVDQEMTITAGGLTTQSKGLGAAGNSEHPRSNAEAGVRTTSRPAITATVGTLGGPVQQITRAASRVTSTTSARPGAGLQGRVSSTMVTATTTTPHQNLYTTTFPGVAGRSRWTAKKNISSNTKTGVKPLPGRGPKPGENHKPAIKPEVDRRLKKPKNDRKPDQAPLPDKKTKHDQKQRPSHQKPTTDQRSNPDKGPKRDQIPKPDQRPPTDNLPTDQSRNNIPTPKLDQEDTTDQNQLPVQRPTSHQRPETLNRTGSDKGPRTDQDPEIPSNNQNSKKPLHPLKTDKLDQEQKPHKKTKSEEKTNPDQRSTINQYVPSAQEPEPERTKTASFTPKPEQNPVREVFENPGENPSPDPKSVQHESPGQKLKPDRTQIKPSEQKPKPNQTPKTEGKQKPDQKTKINQYVPSYHESDPERGETASFKPKPDQNPATEFEETSEINPTTEPKSVQDLSPGQKLTPDRTQIKHSDQKPKPNHKPKAEGKQKTDQRSTINQYAPSVQEPDPETSDTVSLTPKPDRKPVTELLENPDESPSPEPKSVQDSSSGKKLTPDRTLIKPSDQKPKTHIKPKTGEKQKPDERSTINQYVPSYQEPEPDRKPVTELLENPDESPSPEPKSVQDSSSGKKLTPDRTLINPSNQRPKPNQIPSTEFEENSEINPTTTEPKSVQDSSSGKKLTPDRTLIKPSDQKPKTHIKPKTGEKQKPDERSTINQYVPSYQEPKPERTETASFTPKPKQNPGTESLESPDTNPSPEPNSVQEPLPGQKLTPDRTQKPKPDQKSKLNQYVPSVQEPDPEISETVSLKPKPNQKPATEFEENSYINPSPDPNSVQDSSSGKKLTPDRTLIKPSDQLPKPKQNPKTERKQKPDERSSINQYVPSYQGPGSEKGETASFTPKPKQNPETESFESSDPSPEPNSVQEPSPGQKLTPDHTQIKPSDQKPKPHIKPKTGEKQKPDQKSKLNQYVPSVQEPDPERSETARVTPKPKQNPGTELLERSEILTSPEPVQDSSSGQKRPHDRNLIKPSDQKPKNPKTEEKQKPDQRSTVKQTVPSVQEPDPQRSDTVSLKPKPDQNPGREFVENSDRNASTEPNSVQDSSPREKPKPDRALIKPKPSQKTPKIHQKPKPGQPPKLNQKHPDPTKGQKTKPHVKPKPNQRPQTNQEFKTPQPDEMPDLNPKSVPDEIPGAESNKTSKPRPPTRPRVRPGATSFQRPKPSVQLKPSPETKTDLDPPQITRTTTDSIQNSQTDMPPASGHKKQTADVTHSPGETEFSPSRMKTITLGPKTSNSLETGPFPRLHAPPEGFTMSPNSRVTSDLRPQTVGQPPSIPMTTRPNKFMHGILPSVIPSTSPGSTKPSEASDSVSRIQPKILHNMEETAPRQTPDPDKTLIAVPSPSAKTTSTTSPDFGSTSPATSGPEPLAPEASTPSARELRVKINQVAAFFNNSLSPNGRVTDRQPIESPEDNEGGSRPDRTDSKRPTLPSKGTSLRRDCSDYLLRGDTKSGVYLVTPDLRSRSFSVFCDMELDGGGWTLLQRRQDGSVSFNRTWDEYRSGFGELDGGEFWLGNNMIHVLTRDRDMMLRVELEDFDGVMEYAEYEQFKVASERWRYRLSVDGYSGTAGDALRFSKSYDHNNRAFTTPDRDHDRYPSGNCGAYYSSGWWFDACMAANLNGRYYVGKYKGVRDGIFWGTWRNISTEYYPTNDRQSFKTVRMMIRPNGFRP